MGELAGAVAGVQVGRLPSILSALRTNKARILESIGSVPGLERRRLPDPNGDGSSSITWFLRDATTAKQFAAALRDEGVPCAQMYRGRPVYLSPSYWRDAPHRTRAAVGVCRAPDGAHLWRGPVPPDRGARRPLDHRAHRRRLFAGRLRRDRHRGARRREAVAVVTERIAIVGCGTAATHIHIPLLRAAGVDVTVFASRSRSSAEAARDVWGDGTVVDRWEDAVTRDDVDAVVVATPNAQHRDVAVAAMRAGKHVLVDKPLARTRAEADDMIAAASEHGVVLTPFQNTRFMAPFVAAHDAVSEGRIGEVTGVRAAFAHSGPQAWPRARPGSSIPTSRVAAV